MAKRFIPIRLDEKLRRSLDRFVDDWNRSGAPRTNRTFVVTSAIEQYLKRWRPTVKGFRSVEGRHAPATHGRVVHFRRTPSKDTIPGGLKKAI